MSVPQWNAEVMSCCILFEHFVVLAIFCIVVLCLCMCVYA